VFKSTTEPVYPHKNTRKWPISSGITLKSRLKSQKYPQKTWIKRSAFFAAMPHVYAILLRIMPTPVISVSTMSPGFKNSGGFLL
jgi:hypothetical protein